MPGSSSLLFRAGRVDCALQERRISQHSAFAQCRWFAYYAEAGQAHATTASGDFDINGPAILWGPMDDSTRLKAGAGSVGHYLFLSDALFNNALGSSAESTELRLFASRHVMTSFARADPHTTQVSALFETIAAEHAQPGFGTEIAVAAQIVLLLLMLRRRVPTEPSDDTLTSYHSSEIDRFRALVEAHFRSRWKVMQYADALGMTYDRLRDLCLRTVGKPPASLLRERSVHEAQILLQRTSLSTERVATVLGFSSASQFSHFFKLESGEAPGAFRKRLIRLSEHAAEAEVSRFSDWP